MPGGYTHGGKTFELGDATILTVTSDHNGYLVDFRLTFEIRDGERTGGTGARQAGLANCKSNGAL